MNFFNVKSAAIIAVAVSMMYAFDKAPSTKAPVTNPPQLIVLGSDDNTDPVALNWVVSVLKKYTNKNDGTPLRMSFYSNTKSWKPASDIVIAHMNAYKSGHEVSNHTNSHVYCVTDKARLSQAEIKAEIDKATTALIDLAGIPKAHQFGFRTPYLAYSDSTFSAVQEAGFLYDCSVNGGAEWETKPGTGYYWPHTLNTDDGEGNFTPDNTAKYNYWNNDAKNPIRKHSGLWELSCQLFQADPQDTAYMSTVMKYDHGGKVTALDYNLWSPSGGAAFNKDQSLRTLKNTLDMMHAGNRTPMTVGVHSQYYFQTDPTGTAYPNMRTKEDRQWMLEEFIKYAVTKKDVWFVSGDMVIKFMQNPVSAANFKPENYATIGIATEDKNLAPTGINLSNSTIETGTTSVGTLSTIDPNATDVHTYSLSSGTDKFEISGSSLNLKSSVAAGDYTVKVKTTDNGGLSFEKDFTIKVIAGIPLGKPYEIIGTDADWRIESDKLKTGSIGKVSGTSPVIFELKKGTDKKIDKDSTDYAWINATTDLDTTLYSVSQIEIVYNADKDAKFGLTGMAVNEKDTNYYGYTTTLEKGDNKTKILKVANFDFSWAENEKPTKPSLKFNEVNSLNIESDAEGETSVTIKSIKLYGYKKPVATALLNLNKDNGSALKVSSIGSNQLILSVPTAGAYQIAIYSVDGRKLLNRTVTLNAGSATISLDGVASTQCGILQVNGQGLSLTSKVVMK